MRMKAESERAGLKVSIKNTKAVASGPTASRQTEGEEVEVATDFLSLCSESLRTVTAVRKPEDGCCLAGKL